MSREHWFFVAGVIATLIPLALVLAGRKLELFNARPDQLLAYRTTDAGELYIHGFHPRSDETASHALPAVVFFHGGRWMFGSPRGYYPQCRFFTEHGYRCFSVQYRLGEDGRVDVRQAVEDARFAFEYLLEHARELGIDAARIAVGGGSSGGHLAATLGVPIPVTAGWQTAQRRPAAQLLLNPMLDLSPCRPDHHLVREYWREVSPLQHVDASVPPTLILTGDEDPELPLDSVHDYCSALDRAGVHCELEVYGGQTHGFFQPGRGDGEYFHRSNRRMLAFLERLWSEPGLAALAQPQ